jgi:predicted deacylase
MTNPDPGLWGGLHIGPGERRTVDLVISETYAGTDLSIPVHVCRGPRPGPTVFVTGAVHGDEINGTWAIRQVIRDHLFEIVAGTLVLVPVVNLPGFERHSRYLPDRRDLNRSFPGSREGSLARRLAWSFFEQVVRRCEYGIDLHTAAVRRTNFPNVRADMSDPRLAAFAKAFGAELIVSGRGPVGSLRRSACDAGCATLILEAGEVWKVEPAVVEYVIRGVTNCLRFLEMVEGTPNEPPYRIETDSTKWIRADRGGFLEFHVAPGDIVAPGEAIATNTSLTGEEQNVITTPRNGVILGITTLPSVSPGDPVCHIASTRRGALRKVGRIVDALAGDSLHERMRDDLASNVLVTGTDEGPARAGGEDSP